MIRRSLAASAAIVLLSRCASPPAVDAGIDAVQPGLDALADAPPTPSDATDADRGRVVSLSVPAGTLSIAQDGTIDLVDPAGLPMLALAHADVLLGDNTRSTLVQTGACVVEQLDAASVPTLADSPLAGQRDTLAMHCEPSPELGLDVYVQSHAPSTAITTRLRVRAHRDLNVLRIAPLAVTGPRGALFHRGPVSDDRIVDNGSLVVGDFTVRLYRGDHSRDVLAGIIPIPVRGNIVANGDLGLHDLTDGTGLAAGFLTHERGFTLVGIGASSSTARVRSDHAFGYDTFVGETVYFPSGKPIASGSELWSEMFYLDVAAPDGIIALERYGDAVEQQQHITPWHARSTTGVGREGRHVPSAWQSWCLGYQGGYAHDINSTIIRANVDAAARDLSPYGFDIVPIDDGWQTAWGDWTPDPMRFATGWSGETGYARANGLGSGFWIAPFGLDPVSATAMMHPEWIAAIDPTLGPIFVGSGSRVLDLSRDDVIARVRQVAHDMNAAGLAWYKQDFAYRALAIAPSDRTMTSVEAYRRGMAAVRAETPDPTLMVTVAIFAPNYGVADAIRTGLDTGGRWDELPSDPESATGATRAFKTTVRTATRRWYLNDRVVLLDPDAIAFRAMDQPPTIGDTEERTFALYQGLLGGVLEVGDPLVGMRPFAQDTVRRLIPLYGRAARPLDVFVRDYNERWALPVVSWSSDPDAPAPWALVAATNWGRNRDWSTTPPQNLDDAARRYHFSRAEIGLGSAALVAWELWSRQVVTVTADGIDVDVPAHESVAIAVRERRDGVQLLGTDRHVTAGAVDVVSERWDAAGKVFTLVVRAVAAGAGGRTMTVHAAVRADATIVGTPSAALRGVTAADLTVQRTGERIDVSFTPDATATATLTLSFAP